MYTSLIGFCVMSKLLPEIAGAQPPRRPVQTVGVRQRDLTTRIRWCIKKGWECILDGFVLGPGFPFRYVARLLGVQYYVTNIRGVGPVTLRPGTTDGGTFSDVFRRKEYDLSLFPQFRELLAVYQHIRSDGRIPVIVDCGANVGAATIWLSRLFPYAHVVAVEPDADNARMCRVNTHNLGNVLVIEAAIGSEEGQVSLHNTESDTCSVSIQTERKINGNVRICTIDDVVRSVQGDAMVFLVKIDIEGFERDLFASNLDWLENAAAVIIEPHDWLFPGRGTSANFQKAFADRGFEILVWDENLFYFRSRPQQAAEGAV